jgi:hypothetical protein
MDISEEQIENEIKTIFNQNKIQDLKKFIAKRNCLNISNQVMNYLFHIVQSAGVLTTTIAAGYNMKELVWIGVGLNILASLINVFEKTNDAISKRLLKDIHAIKNGTYVDEGMMIEDIGGAKKVEKHEKKTDDNSESADLVEKGFLQQLPQDKNERVRQVLKSPLISEGEK